jgi:hypothetical protein
MAIAASDIKLLASTDGLGGAITATELVNDTVANLFDNVSGAEAAAGDTEYRAFYIRNDHATLTWQGVKFWIGSNTTSADDTLTVGIDLAMVAAPVSAGAGDTIADESTAPDPAVTFVTAVDEANCLTIGNMEPAHYTMIWVKRVVGAAAGAASANAATLNWTGDTEA